MTAVNSRHIRVRPAAEDEISVPTDVAAMLGPEAELELGPGRVTIRQSGTLSRSQLATLAKPAKTAGELLGQPGRPLTDTERAALTEFLNG